MANRAYLGLWLRDESEAALSNSFRRFLETVPFSSRQRGFTQLEVHAISNAETPLLEMDLRSAPANAEGVLQLTADFWHDDSSYEVAGAWDLWEFDGGARVWKLRPQPLQIACRGPEYDDGLARESGNIQTDLGFEHFFTGHARLLSGGSESENPAALNPAESAFLAALDEAGQLDIYRDKTSANIRALFEWMERARADVNVGDFRLWSEGEENFEARMEEILAAR